MVLNNIGQVQRASSEISCRTVFARLKSPSGNRRDSEFTNDPWFIMAQSVKIAGVSVAQPILHIKTYNFAAATIIDPN